MKKVLLFAVSAAFAVCCSAYAAGSSGPSFTCQSGLGPDTNLDPQCKNGGTDHCLTIANAVYAGTPTAVGVPLKVNIMDTSSSSCATATIPAGGYCYIYAGPTQGCKSLGSVSITAPTITPTAPAAVSANYTTLPAAITTQNAAMTVQYNSTDSTLSVSSLPEAR